MNRIATLVLVVLHRSRTWRFELMIVVLMFAALARALLSLRRDVTAGVPLVITGRELVAFSVAATVAAAISVKIFGGLRFRFIIDGDGLTIRTADIAAVVHWSDIESIVMDDLRILVVPTLAYQPDPYPGITRNARTTADGRACFEVLALSQVRVAGPDRISSRCECRLAIHRRAVADRPVDRAT